MRPILDRYASLVYDKKYNEVAPYYHPNAVLVETDKKVFHTPPKIVDAIRSYRDEYGPYQTVKLSEKFETTGNDWIFYSSTWEMTTEKRLYRGPFTQVLTILLLGASVMASCGRQVARLSRRVRHSGGARSLNPVILCDSTVFRCVRDKVIPRRQLMGNAAGVRFNTRPCDQQSAATSGMSSEGLLSLSSDRVVLEAKNAVRAVIDIWEDAWHREDWDRMASVYHPDAVMVECGKEAIYGNKGELPR